MTSKSESPDILTCGHPPSPHGEHTTGTAHAADGREICWACADDEERERMRAGDHLDAYLSGDGTAITTWSGGHLARVTSATPRRNGFHGSTIVYLRAVDAAGKRWHGTSPGRGMYARLRAARPAPARAARATPHPSIADTTDTTTGKEQTT